MRSDESLYYSDFFENSMTFKDSKDQELKINNEYRKILLKKEKIRKKTTAAYIQM